MTKPRRILYVIGTLDIGGAERHLVQVATGLKLAGHAPEVFVLKSGGPFEPSLRAAGVPIHAYEPPAWLQKVVFHQRVFIWIRLGLSALKMASVLWRRRPDVVHFFLPAAYVVGGMVSLVCPVPVRIMSRRSLNNYQSKHWLLTRVERFLHRRMSLVCGNSLAVNRQLIEEGVASDRVRLIYNGVSDPLADDATTAGKDKHVLRYVMVANLIPYKGHADLLDAFGSVQHELPPDWQLWCIGRDDGIQASLIERAGQLGIAGNVKFLGSRTDVPSLLRLADVGVLSSHEEGFSNAVLEGMAAGLPMVVTDVGGNAEAVLDGETGYVVPPRDPARLGQALLAVARDGDRARMGARGRQRVQNLFTVGACLRQYEVLYQQADRVGQPGIFFRSKENT